MRVLARDGAALLLERASGGRCLAAMARAGADDEATQILCRAAVSLHAPRGGPRPPTLVPLEVWFRALAPAARRFGGILEDADRTARALLATAEAPVVLHGDIHHENVLDGGPRGWLAIDPQGLIGERGFDYANILCNPDIEVAGARGRLRARVAIIAEEAGLEPRRILAWTLAYAGLSASWTLADGDDASAALAIYRRRRVASLTPSPPRGLCAQREETQMSRTLMAVFAAAALVGGASDARAQPAPAYVTTAVADPGRPADDTARDALRKPAAVVAFAGVKPGDKVYELLPGGGYFTRILSKTVGPGGHVFAAVPDPKSPFAEPAAAKIAADPAYANVSVVLVGPAGMSGLPPLDAIWTSDNYHDLHLSQVHIDVVALDRQWFAALKSGGVLLIIDHVAPAGSPATETADKLHRIDPAVIRQEVESAGFRFAGASDVLRNPADPHTAIVFDPSIRGHTDQVVFRFVKP